MTDPDEAVAEKVDKAEAWDELAKASSKAHDLLPAARVGLWLVEQWLDGREPDGGDIQDILEKVGLIRPSPVPYDPAIHGEHDWLCKGDTNWLALTKAHFNAKRIVDARDAFEAANAREAQEP